MSKRWVVRCNRCGTQEDMVMPVAATMSVSWGGFGGQREKPHPPEGWSEQYGGMRGILDFCSAQCALEWEHTQTGDSFA